MLLAKITELIVAVKNEERGASMVEYALLVVLIAIIAIVAITVAGREVSAGFSIISSGLGSAG